MLYVIKERNKNKRSDKVWSLQMMNHHTAFKKSEPKLNVFTWTELKNRSSQGEKKQMYDTHR